MKSAPPTPTDVDAYIPLDQPIPYELIGRIVKLRVKALQQRANARRTARAGSGKGA